MWKAFCNWILYKRLKWTKDITEAHPDKYIICLAPHTSNWDMLLGQAFAGAEGLKINFLMKKEWFFWPLGPIFKRMGGIPVWRSKRTSMTDNLAETARNAKTFHLCITPEGTRSLNPDWKSSSARRPLSPRATLTRTCAKSSSTSRISRARSLISSPLETWRTDEG